MNPEPCNTEWDAISEGFTPRNRFNEPRWRFGPYFNGALPLCRRRERFPDPRLLKPYIRRAFVSLPFQRALCITSDIGAPSSCASRSNHR